MPRFYFTFGFGQPHENGFHVIEAMNWSFARQKMIDRFGMHWSMQYDEGGWILKDGRTQQETYGLHEVK